jgi:putative glutamine amidotransferase
MPSSSVKNLFLLAQRPGTPRDSQASGRLDIVRPVIGITCYVEQTRWEVWDTRAAVLPYAYVDHIERAGGRAVLIPPSLSEPAELLDRIDGLVLAGGADIDPVRYGAERHPETVEVRPDRDTGELALLGVAWEQRLPLLGICRGMQLMAVAAKGHLHQHLPEVVGHHGHLPQAGTYGDHSVRLAAASRLGDILGEAVDVHSHHHHSVADPGSLDVTGWADDGTIEAMEAPDRPFAIGVQWHPEVGHDPRLFRAFVDAARP